MTIAYFQNLSVTDGHFQQKERFEARSRSLVARADIEMERFLEGLRQGQGGQRRGRGPGEAGKVRKARKTSRARRAGQQYQQQGPGRGKGGFVLRNRTCTF